MATGNGESMGSHRELEVCLRLVYGIHCAEVFLVHDGVWGHCKARYRHNGIHGGHSARRFGIGFLISQLKTINTG